MTREIRWEVFSNILGRYEGWDYWGVKESMEIGFGELVFG